MMRCIKVSEFGLPEVLNLVRDVPTPQPIAKQVLVNIKAAGVNPVDTYIRSGAYAALPKLPYTPGNDGAGVVHQVGDDVIKVKKGDRVWFSRTSTGSYSEYCLCEENDINILPETLTFEQGAMMTPYMTAHKALFKKGKVQHGETVLIHGATGGVGTAAIQMCHSYGVRVIGTAGSEEGIKMLNDMGVDAAYNHRQQGYFDQLKKSKPKIDLILEMLANVNLVNDLEIVSHSDGRIVIIGSRGPIEIQPRAVMMSEAIVTGVMLSKSTVKEREEQKNFINEGMRKGWLKPILWKSYELEHTCQAHREIIENSGAKGQIVLNVHPSSLGNV